MDFSVFVQDAALVAGAASVAATAIGSVAHAAGALFNLLGWTKASAFATKAATTFSAIGVDFQKLFGGNNPPAAPVRHLTLLPPPK
jgi:hypothetical protein